MNDPDQVLQALLAAVARKDDEAFFATCRADAQVIGDHFASWTQVPPEVRQNPELVANYGHTLIQVAQLFEQNGFPQLMAKLMPPGEDNILTRWQNALSQVQELADTGDINQSLAKAEALCAELAASGATGTGLLEIRAKTRGLMGRLHFGQKRYGEARAAMKQALDDCERGGDLDGVRIYRENLALLETRDPVRPDLIDLEIEVLKTFAKAQRLAELRRYQKSSELLAGLLARGGDAGKLVEAIRAQVLGRLGFNEFKLGRLSEARKLIASARDLCTARHDLAGAEVYAENLGELGPEESGIGKMVTSFRRMFGGKG